MRRNAILFVLISLLSGFGSTAMLLAAGLWILDLTGSVGLAALTGICIYAPTLAAPWLGLLVDRLPRRPLLIAVDLALGAALLTLLAVRSPGGVWLIFLVLLARGVGYVLVDAGESAILPAALPPSLLGDVNGWRSSAQEGTKLVAPLAGAGLYAWHGAVPVILLSAAMPLLTAGCYALLQVHRRTEHAEQAEQAGPVEHAGRARHAGHVGQAGSAKHAERAGHAGQAGSAKHAERAGHAGQAVSVEHAGQVEQVGHAGQAGSAEHAGHAEHAEHAGQARSADHAGETGLARQAERAGQAEHADRGGRGVRAGLVALFGMRVVRLPVLVAAAVITLSGLTNAAVLARIVHDLHLPAAYLGFLATAQGAGSIVGGLLVGRLLARASAAVVAATGAAIFAAGCAVWCLPWWPAMITGSVLVGVGLPWTLIAAVTAIQTRTPEHLLGRVAATSTMLMFGPIALSIPLGSALIAFGARPPLILVSVLALLTGALALRPAHRSPAEAGAVRPAAESRPG
jgi:MFS family permease